MDKKNGCFFMLCIYRKKKILRDLKIYCAPRPLKPGHAYERYNF